MIDTPEIKRSGTAASSTPFSGRAHLALLTRGAVGVLDPIDQPARPDAISPAFDLAIAQGRAVRQRRLRLNDDPSAEQVVAHLRHCADTDVQPNREVYAFLNLHADSAEIAPLRNEACLHIGGRWLKPSEVFWTEHPFGQWRVRLGHDLSRYRELFDALGVEDAPNAQHALEVWY